MTYPTLRPLTRDFLGSQTNPLVLRETPLVEHAPTVNKDRLGLSIAQEFRHLKEFFPARDQHDGLSITDRFLQAVANADRIAAKKVARFVTRRRVVSFQLRTLACEST